MEIGKKNKFPWEYGKKKNARKILMFFTVCISFMILNVTVYAQTEYVSGYFRYILTEDSITIIGYNGREEEVVIPAEIAGCPVNTIASGAFEKAGTETVISLPDPIMTIEEGAFLAGQTVKYRSNTTQKAEIKPVEDLQIEAGEMVSEEEPAKETGEKDGSKTGEQGWQTSFQDTSEISVEEAGRAVKETTEVASNTEEISTKAVETLPEPSKNQQSGQEKEEGLPALTESTDWDGESGTAEENGIEEVDAEWEDFEEEIIRKDTTPETEITEEEATEEQKEGRRLPGLAVVLAGCFLVGIFLSGRKRR